jgi:hypothetical protein
MVGFALCVPRNQPMLTVPLDRLCRETTSNWSASLCTISPQSSARGLPCGKEARPVSALLCCAHRIPLIPTTLQLAQELSRRSCEVPRVLVDAKRFARCACMIDRIPTLAMKRGGEKYITVLDPRKIGIRIYDAALLRVPTRDLCFTFGNHDTYFSSGLTLSLVAAFTRTSPRCTTYRNSQPLCANGRQ